VLPHEGDTVQAQAGCPLTVTVGRALAAAAGGGLGRRAADMKEYTNAAYQETGTTVDSTRRPALAERKPTASKVPCAP
jgi:hypothetical protein